MHRVRGLDADGLRALLDYERAPAPDATSPGTESSTPANNQPLRHGVAEQTPHRTIRAR